MTILLGRRNLRDVSGLWYPGAPSPALPVSGVAFSVGGNDSTSAVSAVIPIPAHAANDWILVHIHTMNNSVDLSSGSWPGGWVTASPLTPAGAARSNYGLIRDTANSISSVTIDWPTGTSAYVYTVQIVRNAHPTSPWGVGSSAAGTFTDTLALGQLTSIAHGSFATASMLPGSIGAATFDSGITEQAVQYHNATANQGSAVIGTYNANPMDSGESTVALNFNSSGLQNYSKLTFMWRSAL